MAEPEPRNTKVISHYYSHGTTAQSAGDPLHTITTLARHGLVTVELARAKLGRRGQASELNTQYFLDGANYMKAAEVDLAMPTLFDVEAFNVEAAS